MGILATVAMTWCPPGAEAVPCQVCEHNGSYWTPWQPIGNGVWTHTHFQFVANCQSQTYDRLICMMTGGAYQAWQEDWQRYPDGSVRRTYAGFVWLTPDCVTDDGSGCDDGNATL